MYLSTRPLILAAVIAGAQCATVMIAFPQTTPAPANTLSAREIFYLADEIAAPPKSNPNATSTAQPTPHKSNRAKPNPTSTQTAQTTESRPTPASSNASVQSATGQVHVTTVTDRKHPPLGMRYAVYRLVGGNKEPVDADTVFHSNDHIQFTVDVNTPAYLYVVSRGASGKWSTLFPASGADPNANLVQPHTGYTFPPEQMITFTDPAGKEELFLFLSRQPLRSTEDLMLQMSEQGKPAPSSLPAQQLPHGNVVEAFNRMDDSQISLVRTAFSRDLIVEKVNTDSGTSSAPPVAQAPAKDNSVYVVNPSTGADAHVVADLTFQHQ